MGNFKDLAIRIATLRANRTGIAQIVWRMKCGDIRVAPANEATDEVIARQIVVVTPG